MDPAVDCQGREALLNSYLLLDRHVVGVHFYSDPEAFEEADLPLRRGRATYCQMIKKASEGQFFKAWNDTFACDTSARMLLLMRDVRKMECGDACTLC